MVAEKSAQGGRPTDYTPEMVESVYSYVKNYEFLGDSIPSLAGLAFSLGLSNRTLQLWAKDPEKKKFFRALEFLKSAQERVALNKGLSGEFNSAITKLVLHNHGYSEKNEMEVSGNTFSVQIVKPDGAD